MKPTHCPFRLLATGLLAGSAASAGVLITGQHSGHTYQVWGHDGVTHDERSYLDAATFAAGLSFAGEPGRLVRVDDAAENAFVHGLLVAVNASLTTTVADGGGVRYAWLGADDLAVEGVWRWHSGGDQFWQGGPGGSSVGGLHQNWAVGTSGQSEPDNFLGTQDAAAMVLDPYPAAFPGLLGQPGQWNDINHLNVLPFIVEFAAVPEPAAAGLVAGALLLFAGWRARACRAATAPVQPSPGRPGR